MEEAIKGQLWLFLAILGGIINIIVMVIGAHPILVFMGAIGLACSLTGVTLAVLFLSAINKEL